MIFIDPVGLSAAAINSISSTATQYGVVNQSVAQPDSRQVQPQPN